MRFSHDANLGKRYSRNLCKAYKITGRIIRNSHSLNAMPFYRSLLLYRGLMQLEKSAKSDEDSFAGKELLYPASCCPADLDNILLLKRLAARECFNCLSDSRAQNLASAKGWADKRGPWLAPVSRFLGKMIDAYADIRATVRREETPLPAAETGPSSKLADDVKRAVIATAAALALLGGTIFAMFTAIKDYAALIGGTSSAMYIAVAFDLWRGVLRRKRSVTDP